MNVYGDFTNYAGGIYEQTSTEDYVGIHAVKLIGWGYSQTYDVYYWIGANTWSENWGE